MRPLLLLESRIEDALASLGPSLDPLEAVSRLRNHLEPEKARAAAELYQLRHRAREKLPQASRLLLTRRGFEQATDQRVARIRAERLSEVLSASSSDGWVLDATAGIGGDSLVLLSQGVERLVSADADPGTAALLARNLATVAGRARVVCQRAEAGAVRARYLCLDPDRRAEGPRSGDPNRWSPDWDVCMRLAREHAGATLKLAPATDVERLEVPDGLRRSWRWVSLGGELKEVTLSTGELADAGDPDEREVVAVARDGSAHRWRSAPNACEALDPAAAREVRWIADPDPGLVRSGLLGALAREEGIRPLAPRIAYLGGNHPTSSPLLADHEVLASAPLDRRRIRELLRRHDVGRLTVKKRGHPDDAAVLAQRFRGSGSQPGLMIVTRLADGHHSFLVRRSDPGHDR